jgi:D-beta-D-heptose 7-phosphate kinase/D-beta-D-heptose 1-phosphate adenosyltransferase
LDQDGDRAGFLACGATIEARAVELIEAHDVVVLSDYNKGTLAAGVLRGVIERCRERSTPCAIDPKLADFSQYRGAWVLTPNLHEAEQALGRRLFGDGEVSAGCRELRERLGLEAMLITRGPEGMTLSTSEGESHFPAVVREVSDVTGAGDTVMAVLARGLGRREDLREACRLASIAAGIAVSQPGAYVVRADELEAARRGRSPKIVDWEEARRRLDRERRLGRDIVFTNGCFDILHAGHLASLEQARGCGHFLVVGLNSDGSIRANKGPARPILTESHRAALLAGLECVDLVVVFDEETPERLIRHLEPKVLVKGGDYTIGQIVGADLVQSWGGRVVTIPLVAGLSTTSILAEARRGPHAPLGGVNAMVGRER